MKIQFRKSKIILIIMFVFISSGFALLSSKMWRINKDDPTIWIKACDDLKNHTWSGNNIYDSTDVLASVNQATYTQVLTSIINDYNNIQDSYIRLAKYPDDPSNPGSPSAGDSTFTTAKGDVRTIEVCFTDPGSVLAGGDASQKVESKDIIGCKIRIKKDYKDDLENFVATLTHEIGHCLGLDHPMDTTNAIMSYFRPDDKIRLMSDDKMGMIFIYPNDPSAAKESNTFGLSCARK